MHAIILKNSTPLNEVAQFIQDVYEGHKGVDPDVIAAAIRSSTVLQGVLSTNQG